MRILVLSTLIGLVVPGVATAAERFQSIFDGKTLKGWNVIPAEKKNHWSVRDGLLVGKTDGKGSDLIFHDKNLSDYELKLSYRFRTKGNSGIHIRGLLGISKTHKISGYHADFGHVGVGPEVLGSWDFHGYPRGSYLVQRGHRVVIAADGKKTVTKLERGLEASHVKRRDWNDVHVVVKGYRMFFTINGRMASEVIDNEKAKRIPKGIIGLQLHGGPSMEIEFRQIVLKRLDGGGSE
ncbi:MAG: DUF1080 domain-containing protein [Planctomycetota bacterium]|nr:DUF1080 domain-containing protein [Planctomycetota bacterium]